MSYFEKQESYKTFIKILLGIIGVLLIVNILMFKGLINVVENKTIQIEVPQFMESGKYIIGNTFASENVYKMWVRVWLEDIATFSFNNIEQKYKNLYPFLDPQTAYKSKSDMFKFIKFVKNNFVTQKFKLEDMKVERLQNGYVKITAYGTIYRNIGSQRDSLSGLKYAYEFVTYIRNGQIYINAVKSYFAGIKTDVNEKKKIKRNKFVNFNEILQ